MRQEYPFPAKSGVEPALSELLDDPVLHALLARDGLAVADVRDTVTDWRNRNPGKSRRMADAA